LGELQSRSGRFAGQNIVSARNQIFDSSVSIWPSLYVGSTLDDGMAQYDAQ
jgi:hypothetical protein